MSSKYRLLMLSGDSSVVSGVESTFFEMLKEFSLYWRHIDIICPQPTKITQTSFFKDKIQFYPTGKNMLTQIYKTYQIANHLTNTHQYDLVVSHDYGLCHNGFVGYMLNQDKKIPWISEILHIEGFPLSVTTQEKILRRIGQVYIKTALPYATAIRCMNKYQVPQELVRLGINQKKILHIPAVFIDSQIFQPNPQSSKSIDVLFVGRLVPNKQVQVIMRALRILKDEGIPLKFRIIGTGTLQSHLEHLVQSLELTDLVKIISYLKNRKELVKIYQHSKILVCASSSEGGPRVTAEAMACGTPIITTRVGIMPELIKHQYNGLFFDGSPQDLTTQIRYLIENDTNAQSIASKGRTTILNQCTKNKVIQHYAKTYHQVIEENRPFRRSR